MRDKCFECFVSPGISIPQEATAIHGITDDMVQSAPSFHTVMKEFTQFCDGNVILVAHNGAFFDFVFLYHECRRAQVSLPDHWQGLDSLIWARKYRKDLPKHSLQYLRQIYHIQENKAHRALDDAKMLAMIFSLMTDDLSYEEIFNRGEGKKILEYIKEARDGRVQSAPSEQLLFTL